EDAIGGWIQRYQNHYAHMLITNELIEKSNQSVQRPSKIGLLLPIKGKHKKHGIAVRDGFLAAWYTDDLDKQEKADIQIYDANNINIIEVYQQALKDGVDYIVGPLEKEAVNQLYDNTDISVKILALNRQDQKEAQSSNKNLIQFGLSPEDEAIQIAKIAMSDGHKRALVLTPETPWGNRLAETFIQHWIELGGEISKQISFLDNTTDFSTPVKELLNIDKSEQRARNLRNKLNIKIHNVERRRKDVDFIFAAAVPEDARQLIPQIRFHRADNLPIYSTSDIYTGIIDSAKDIDLNDVIFVDMPWILDSERQLSIIQDVLNRKPWSQEKSRYRRLYALGVDAYNLIPDINRLIQEQNSLMLGETGNLTIDSANIVKRNNLRKAKFVEGKPILQN
ncbi:MAG: penicillin-binding protein activator, partial [Pseudomonadota bacterium]|nr:penicillin-binding protein activator [Pseudomonadota bacterium]